MIKSFTQPFVAKCIYFMNAKPLVMNKKHYLLVCLSAFLITGCWPRVDDDILTSMSSQYEPITLSRTEFENSITPSSNLQLTEPGKIYSFFNLILVNDKHKGFLVYDNTDATSPKVSNYIKIPGATDLAVRNNVYYLNQATDLVALRFLDNQDIQILKRIRDVFPELQSPDGFFATNIPEDHVVVGWKLKQ